MLVLSFAELSRTISNVGPKEVNSFLEGIAEDQPDEIVELFREGKTRRKARERAKRDASSWRFRLLMGLVMAVFSFTLLTALRFLPHG